MSRRGGKKKSKIAYDDQDTDFDIFMTEWQLPSNVRDQLDKCGFTTKAALLGMSEDDISDFTLRKGEKAALRAAVSHLQASFGDGPMVREAVQRTRSPPSALLHELLDKSGGNREVDATMPQAMAELHIDPQQYLSVTPTGENKPRLITDYVCGAVVDQSDEISLGQGATLKLATSKPKLSSVSPAMWIAANARVMAAMVDCGELDSTNIKDYMAYTAKIGELAARFTWASVLAYDQEYRCRQAAARFRWGADSQHLSTVLLKEKVTTTGPGPATPRRGTPGAAARRLGPGGREICLQFNSGKCSYGAKCNFEHVCSVCLQNHPQSDHRTPHNNSKQD